MPGWESGACVSWVGGWGLAGWWWCLLAGAPLGPLVVRGEEVVGAVVAGAQAPAGGLGTGAGGLAGEESLVVG